MAREVPAWRSSWLWEQVEYMEKRQMFLRSYHFSRKKPRAERARCYAVRVGRIVCARLRSAGRLPGRLMYRVRVSYFLRMFRRQPYRPVVCGGDSLW